MTVGGRRLTVRADVSSVSSWLVTAATNTALLVSGTCGG